MQCAEMVCDAGVGPDGRRGMTGVAQARRDAGSVGYHAGLSAEDTIARHYERRGLPMADRRWRGRAGEVDLIARDGEGLVFIEVKKSRTFARAAERLSRRQMDRLCRAAEEYLARMPRGSLTDVRFDLALVDARGGVQVIENAFGAA